jgi:hypothetical protein
MLWLTNTEIDDLCEGLQRKAERLIFLRGLGLNVKTKPNGEPLVMRSNLEAVLGGSPAAGRATVPSTAAQPDAAGLRAMFAKPKRAKAAA